MTTIIPQIKAMTLSGRVIVIVSIVVVGAMAEGDGCRSLIKIRETRLSFILSPNYGN